MMDSIRLQATIGGLATGGQGGAETLLGEMDLTSGVLLVDAARTVRAGEDEVRHEGCAALTNNPAAEEQDALFTDADIRDAIHDYFSFQGRGLLVLDDAVARHNPATKIEPDGLDERGRKYRIAPDMTNGQLAVIAMCWFALRQSACAVQLSAFDDFTADMDVITVGIPGADQHRRVIRYEAGGTVAVGYDGWPV